MTIDDLAKALEEWAPRWIAWERDNVGLQVGDGKRTVRRLLVTLDVTPQIVEEAIKKKIDLIVSHHPLLFRAPKSITTADTLGAMLLQLLEHRIAVYSAHTNIDFAKGGVSFVLAEKLGLKDIGFLSPLNDQTAKLAVFVPVGHVNQVAQAMSEAGAGVIGDYTGCSFRLRGTGTFKGSASANPFLGKKGQLETAEETRLEMIAPRALIPTVVAAMKRAHPYEEVAYDVYPLMNPDPNHGIGAVGNLSKATTLRRFLQIVKRTLKAQSVQYAGELGQSVRRVAVCGGSGSDLLEDAIKAEADAFITADVRYHSFHAAEGRIAYIDAGHWETEHLILKPLAQRVYRAAKESHASLEVLITRYSTNPIHTF